jgi:hypothetical protein
VSPRFRSVLVLLVLLAAVAWVWPTVYRYDKILVDQDTYLVRIHRITGHADILVPEEGWIPAERRWDLGPDGSPGSGRT